MADWRDGEMTARKFFADFVGDEGLAGIHEHARLEAAYGRERGVELGLPGYPDELFDVVIPGSKSSHTNGPVDAMSIPLVLFEIGGAASGA